MRNFMAEKKSITFSRSGRIAVLVIFTFVLFGTLAEAQSGRRVPKRSDPAPTPSTSPSKESDEPPPPEPKRAEPEKPLATLIVTLDSRNFSNGSSISNVILGSCLQRLKQANTLEIRTEKEMSRKQAIDHA